MPMPGLDSLTYVFGLALPRYSTHCIHVLIGFMISGYPIEPLWKTLVTIRLEAYSDTRMIRSFDVLVTTSDHSRGLRAVHRVPAW